MTDNYNVTVTAPNPFWEQLILAIIPLFLMVVILWFVFPRLIKLIAREDFDPLKIGKKEKTNRLTNKFYKWSIRNGLIDKPKKRKFTPKEKREMK